MKVQIHTLDGDVVEVKKFDEDSALDLVQAIGDTDIEVITLALDGDSMTYIRREAIARVDID